MTCFHKQLGKNTNTRAKKRHMELKLHIMENEASSAAFDISKYRGGGQSKCAVSVLLITRILRIIWVTFLEGRQRVAVPT